ncbi:AC4 protein [Sweet potato leaf curl Georgia virus]|uniref:AC4 n=1 Tax=Sweet potato leaf curl Georgia virus TaxID=225752 RepID=Q8V5Z3_9GEMI|nr:AC4 protein [Sweet potato leaf curl Georgia virus]AAL69644.1 AC4 [Sweet potato leaf curl Georgia virus-[16]]
MGLCTSMLSSSSRVKPNLKTPDISTCNTPTAPTNSIQISRELNHHQMSSPTSRKTVITSTGVLFKSTEDLLEEVSRQLMMQQQRP